MLLTGRNSATAGPSGSTFLLSIAYRCSGRP
jgi:hypothetical protein